MSTSAGVKKLCLKGKACVLGFLSLRPNPSASKESHWDPRSYRDLQGKTAGRGDGGREATSLSSRGFGSSAGKKFQTKLRERGNWGEGEGAAENVALAYESDHPPFPRERSQDWDLFYNSFRPQPDRFFVPMWKLSHLESAFTGTTCGLKNHIQICVWITPSRRKHLKVWL